MGSSTSKSDKQYSDKNVVSEDLQKPVDMNEAEKRIRRIHVACRKENPEALKSLINDYKVSVSEPDLETGKTCLHFCASNKKTECAQMVLDTDGSVMNAKDDSGFTAFLTATVAGNMDMVRFLNERGANIKTTDNEGHSATHWAAVCGQSEILDYLHDCGMDLSACDKNGATPLHYAVHASDDVPKEESQKIVRMLLDKKVKVDAVDEDKRTPLIWASSSGREKICEYLLDDGANIEAKDQDGLTALHSAAAKGHAGTVEILLNRKASTESTDKNECTPLFYAIHQENMDCTRLLLEKNADTSHCDKKGRSVAHCAASIGQLEGIKLLRKHNADLWISNRETQDLPVHEAAVNGHTDVVKYLLDETDDPSNINKGNANHTNCLHLAALSNNLPLTKYLVEKGADVNATMKHSSGDKYPYDCAVMQNNHEVADYLRQNKGKSIKDNQEPKREGTEIGVQTTARGRDSSSGDERHRSPRKTRRKPHKKPERRDSPSDVNSDSGHGESDDEKKRHRRHHRKQESNYVSPYKYYPSKGDNRKVVNLNAHRHVIREQVRAYETKRLAAMKLNHANRMQMNGKGFSEERLVRKLARDYNEDVREEDRIPSGHFKSMKEFHNFLKGEIDIADVDEKRLRKLEKVKPIYYITF